MARRIDFEVPLDAAFATTTCRSCRAKIYWRVYEKKDGSEGRMPMHVASGQVDGGKLRMESHHAHCPNAPAHLRKKP